MIIAIDYDGVYNLEPILWKKFIVDAKRLDHTVICITMRYPTEAIKNMPCEVVYTSRKAKRPFAEANNYKIDIWIDDKPTLIIQDAI